MILSAPPTESLVTTVREGAAGTRDTLKLMARMVKQARQLPLIRETALSLVGDLASGNYYAEAEALFNFVRDQIRYTGDVNDMETLQEPVYTLRVRHGDCDDKSMLLASLLESIGHPCRFVVAGYTSPNSFDHVWVETRIGDNWVAADATMQVSFGWYPMPPNVPQTVTAFMRGYI